MKKFTKIISIALALVMLFALTSCATDTADTTAAATDTKADTTPDTGDKTPDTDPVDVKGVYMGTYEKASAMGGTVAYSFAVELKADGYVFESSFIMGGTTYVRTETGAYTVDGEKITFTPAKADTNGEAEATLPAAAEGTIKDGKINVAFKLSMMASAPQDVELKYVAYPEAVGSYAGVFEKAAAMGTVLYSFDLELDPDLTYEFSSSFTMAGTSMTLTEKGTYKIDGEKISFTATETNGEAIATPVTFEGTIKDGTIKAEFQLSTMASARQEVEIKRGK